MFTGIIQQVGTITAVTATAAGARLTIELGKLSSGLKLGDSIAVNGVCLTAAAIAGSAASFDVVRETLSRTTLGLLRAGAKVNLEPAVRADGALDGHIVQGHVDGTAQVRRIDRRGQYLVEFSCERELTDLMVPKGSVAINGVSLTLADVGEGRFSVALIPTTLGETTLADLAVGSAVNIETDIIGKYVLKALGSLKRSGGVTMDKLAQEGYL
jgi:riboflavin synthase